MTLKHYILVAVTCFSLQCDNTIDMENMIRTTVGNTLRANDNVMCKEVSEHTIECEIFHSLQYACTVCNTLKETFTKPSKNKVGPNLYLPMTHPPPPPGPTYTVFCGLPKHNTC